MPVTTRRAQNKSSLSVEQLESRQLLSVTVLPGRINVRTVDNGHAKMTVRILSDGTPASTNLLSNPSVLTFSAVDAGGVSTTLVPLRVKSQDVNGDGVPDLLVKFSRSVLTGLAAGDYQFQVSDGTVDDTQSGTFSIVSRGKGHGHDAGGEVPGETHHGKHHDKGEKHGHGGDGPG